MPQRNRARQFLAMALKDLTAVKAMMDNCAFSSEIFGFHAQQAAEKSLKAWIELTGETAPITHNLITLLAMLEDAGVDVSPWWQIVELNSFAVQYRYEQLDLSEHDLDRRAIIDQVNALISHIEEQFREQ